MSEFSAKDEDKLAAPQAQVKPAAENATWHSKPIILGISAPWLGVCVVAISAAAWYLFAPEGQPSTNDLAFGTGGMELVHEEPVQQERLAFPESPAPVPADTAAAAEALRQIKEYGEANRTAVKLLSETVRIQGIQLSTLKQEISDLEAKVALASAKPVPGEKVVTAQKRAPAASSTAYQSPVAGMRVSAVQTDMAWIYWRDRTWAVQVGDHVGESANAVVVTGIDARQRLVHTSAGTIK